MGGSLRLARYLCLFVVVSLLTRWLSLVVEVLDIDEAAHAVGSWVVLDGGRLYSDFVDNKPPLLYAYYALSQLVLGRGLFPVHWFTALACVPLTALGASAVFGHDRRGVVAALLWLVYGASFLAHDMLAASADLIMLLPAAWAMALASEGEQAPRTRSLFVSGVLLGVATLVSAHAVFWLPALAVALNPPKTKLGVRWLSSPFLIRLLPLLTGFALPLVATWAAFAATGGARELGYWLVWRNLLYAGSPMAPTDALERAASYLLPWLLATAPLWLAWRRSRPLLDPRRQRLIDGSIGLGLVAAVVGFRFYPHYFLPVGFALALGAAPAVAEWTRQARSTAARVFIGSTVAIAIGFAAANAWLWLGRSGVYRETDSVYRAVADRLQRDSCFSGSSLFVWGWAPIFYYEAGRRGARPATRFVAMAQAGLTSYAPGNPDAVRSDDPGVLAESSHWNLLMGDLARGRATYIIDTAPAGIYRWERYPLNDQPQLERYVARHYERLDTISRVDVHKRVGCED